ncbi:hypothetical protein M406DRAFT_345766 [Cryphonectria parasitica EP155]|uniref:Steroid 5-alpha reductase C-terminal domain-containing protein n=1 Tax=Cryphonectria parasitica (strain ATCC 38755 / EP155) TaxID=660469 RepID=A0A9P5CS86_CRYP1|nr:uncharacterized protein M406DRAFT_345766 [Cryphonectria parasitica EP155]KAF3768066.1 hypothetical protein M406DRAFT_345766 [Cryphonectria parasitica EP155]
MPAGKTSSPPPSRPRTIEIVTRGVKKPSPIATTTLIGLRALDPFLQYQILAHGLGAGILARLGLSTIPLSATIITGTGIRLIDRLGLPLERLILLGMAVGSAAEQIMWATYLSQEQLPMESAFLVSACNTFCNSINSLLLIASATSAALSTWPFTISLVGGRRRTRISLPVAAGALLYVAGMALEKVAEFQRKQFKDRAENKGRLCREGLWAWARHINYGGHTLWRAGYALAAGGWIAGAAAASLQAWFFARNGMVSLDYYMSRRYKDQWGRYKEDVPWRLLPGVF